MEHVPWNVSCSDVRFGISLNVLNRCESFESFLYNETSKVSCKTVDDHAELEFNAEVKG